MQHLLTQNKQLLNHVQQLTSQLQKIQQQKQQTEETDGLQNANANNNNSDPFDGSSSSSSSNTASPDIVESTVDQVEPTADHIPSPQAMNPLFEYSSDEINLNSNALPGDPFLVDPFSSSNGVSVEIGGGNSS